MAAFDFPNNPSLNQQFTQNGASWFWNGVVWERFASTTVIGPQGIQGTKGNQGVQGLQGKDGANAGQGTQGAIGNFQGTQGNQGVQGLQGKDGTNAGQGSQGLSNQGVQGTQGRQGLQGAGTQGSQGAVGNFQGTQGTQGTQGRQGAQGVQNGQGTQGTQGIGFQGSQGLSGNFAAKGDQGTQGLKGLQGAQGLQGPPGQGTQGLQGGLASQGTAGFNSVDVEQSSYTCTNPILTNNAEITITDASNAYGTRYITSTQPASACNGDIWYDISGGSGGSSGDKISEGNTEAEVVDTGSDGHFKVTTEGTERLRITSIGKVGINSTIPSATLDIQDLSGLNNDFPVLLVGGGANANGDLAVNSGEVLQTGHWDRGTNTFTERFRFGTLGQLGIGGSNYGSSGQVLTSNGSGSAPSWQTVGAGGGSVAGPYGGVEETISVPIGGIIMWSGSSLPSSKWALCDGNNGTPDLRNRFIVAAHSISKSGTTSQAGPTFDATTGALNESGQYAPGDIGGEAAHQLTEDELASHDHTYAANSAASDYGGTNPAVGSPTSGTTDPTGGDLYHENRPPYYALAFLMRIS